MPVFAPSHGPLRGLRWRCFQNTSFSANQAGKMPTLRGEAGKMPALQTSRPALSGGGHSARLMGRSARLLDRKTRWPAGMPWRSL